MNRFSVTFKGSASHGSCNVRYGGTMWMLCGLGLYCLVLLWISVLYKLWSAAYCEILPTSRRRGGYPARSRRV